ncbi:MAG: TlpA family protein disulfide reductase [Bacteroidia bacterium]|nr:TlpA family protein disulfide reductase [Bacteroidia bacterium]
MFKNKSNIIGLLVFVSVSVFFLLYKYCSNHRIPDISFQSLPLYDLNENPIRLDFASSDITLVSMGASWCPNCRRELNTLKDFFAQYPEKGIRCVVISNEVPGVVKKWKNKTGGPFEFYLLAAEWQDIGIRVLPTNFLVNKNGKILRKKVGEFNPETFLTQP